MLAVAEVELGAWRRRSMPPRPSAATGRRPPARRSSTSSWSGDAARARSSTIRCSSVAGRARAVPATLGPALHGAARRRDRLAGPVGAASPLGRDRWCGVPTVVRSSTTRPSRRSCCRSSGGSSSCRAEPPRARRARAASRWSQPSRAGRNDGCASLKRTPAANRLSSLGRLHMTRAVLHDPSTPIDHPAGLELGLARHDQARAGAETSTITAG